MAAKVQSAARKPRTPRREKLPDTPDPIEIAMIAAAAGGRTPAVSQARALLEKQAILIGTQETLARADLRHRGWQIIGERISAVLKGLTALAGLLLLFAIGAFLWSASRASGMVVDAFSVPPAMDQRGMTGAVVAGQLLDKVSAIEASTQSARAPSSYENSWSDTQGVQVPYAGVSLGELRRDARNWLGSETHLKGEVVQLGGGQVAITFRAGKAAGRVVGEDSEFDSLLQQAAVAIFKATQPYRYHVYLRRTGATSAEIELVLTELSRSTDLKERLWAMHGLALNDRTDAEASAIYARALRLRPDFLPAIGNLPYYAANAGQDEEAYQLHKRSGAAYRAGQPDYNAEHSAGFALDSAAYAAGYEGDFTGAASRRAEAMDYASASNIVAARPFLAAAAQAKAHDFAGARATLAAVGYLDAARWAEGEAASGPADSLRLLHAVATGDDSREVGELTAALQRMMLATGDAKRSRGERSAMQVIASQLRPRLAVALARTGRWQDAAAVIAPASADHDAALRARALVAAYASRGGDSDALFAQAVARTPSLPAAHLAWAEALMVRGETGRAIDQAELAHEKGPRWAEPLKLLGDARLAGGDVRSAVSAYSKAAKQAPRWGKLHMAWANALWREGRRGEARAKLQAAATMDLSDADKRQLNAMWRRSRQLPDARDSRP